jgi:peptidoglycan hydrolase-like protein with peptidoglycan-binding domain
MKTLKKGSKGTEVQQLQTMLNALGYDCGIADGAFGAKTDAAVRAF